jgi:hypothetical protein
MIDKHDAEIPQTAPVAAGDHAEGWVLDGALCVSRRFDLKAVKRRAKGLLPSDVPANSADD